MELLMFRSQTDLLSLKEIAGALRRSISISNKDEDASEKCLFLFLLTETQAVSLKLTINKSSALIDLKL